MLVFSQRRHQSWFLTAHPLPKVFQFPNYDHSSFPNDWWQLRKLPMKKKEIFFGGGHSEVTIIMLYLGILVSENITSLNFALTNHNLLMPHYFIQGDSWKLICCNVLLLSIYSHFRDLIIWKILLIDFLIENKVKKFHI